jgi:hypothetical protein
MLNNAPLVHALAVLDDSSTLVLPVARRRVRSNPCLPERLPSTGMSSPCARITLMCTSVKGFLHREAEQLAPQAILKQLRRSPSPSDHSENGDERRHSRRLSTSPVISSPTAAAAVVDKSQSAPANVSGSSWKDPQVR